MKIAFLTPEYPHPRTGNSGGIGTSIKNLANGLVKEGLAVIIIVYGQRSDSVFEEDGITFYCVANQKFKGLSWLLTRKKMERLINKLYQERRIDLVEAPDWTGITSFVRSKCPLVIRLHGSDSYFCHLENRPVKGLNRFHEKKALKNADALLSVSRYTAEVTKKIFALQRDLTVIPNCHDSVEEVLFATPNSETILYFGTLIRKKGMFELPGIFNKVIESYPSAKLVLIGKDSPDIVTQSGSTWKLMMPLFTDEARMNVQYLGAVPHTQINQQINAATVCVFPTFAEALPVSWLEAMGMGKAIVASDIGWAREIVDDGIDGYLVHPKSHDEFASRIIQLLTDSALREKVGENAKEKIRKVFNTTVVAKSNIEFYKSVLNRFNTNRNNA